MELPPAVVSVVCCSDCHLHQKLSKHSERMYRVAFAERIYYLIKCRPAFSCPSQKISSHNISCPLTQPFGFTVIN